MPSAYLETSIISYVVARPSRDLITAAHQQVTVEWWETRRSRYELFTSELVVLEAGAGDPTEAARRLDLIASVRALAPTDEAGQLAVDVVLATGLPPRAVTDALHIAIAAVNGIDYLLTWNLRHIANAALRGRIERACRARGYEPPVLCTPEQLLEE